MNEFGQKVGLKVVPSGAVQFKPETLAGVSVTLRLIDSAIFKNMPYSYLWQVVETEPDKSCWTYLPYSGFDFSIQLETALKNNFNFPKSVHYLIEVDHKVLGWIALLNPRSEQRAIKVGNVYFSHQMKRSRASTETLHLLLQACFDQGFRRVEWKCDNLNEPSKRAAERFGFQFEGVFRQDRMSKGRNRNTAWFSILDEEWPALQKAYLDWLKPENFDADGQQKITLSDFIKLYSTL